MMLIQRFLQALPSLLISLLLRPTVIRAQSSPPFSLGSNFTTIRSPVDSNIIISFKTPTIGTCTTVFSTQKQYTGYVSIPPFTLAPIQQDYTINTFFWFIEARTNASTAPLTIYLNGGPGSSSMVGLFLESGPCEVVAIAKGQFGTQARDWGWDRSSNILYIDQPNQVGFSYDTPTNGSMNLLTSTLSIPPLEAPSGQPAYAFLNGTFSSNNVNALTNTSAIAARAVWHMLQGFLGAFPQYNPGQQPNSTQSGVVGVNLFAESYGGKYGPAFATFWESQNQLRRNGSLSSNKTLEIKLSSLGILQGCVDDLVQGRYYPIFANGNTFGIQALNVSDQLNAANDYLRAGGCQQQIQSCRDAVASMDPQDHGDVYTVNQICQQAANNCNANVVEPYTRSGRDVYDITQKRPDPFPSSDYLEYLNSGNVQAAIGAMVNYTEINSIVANAFQQTGDYERGDQISQMATLLSLGVRVALIYGDRDYICNWLGGEAVSFSLAAQSPSYSSFYTAGYAQIVVNETYVGGAVRQYGNLSFSRIYDAGHLIPAYQPETAFTVFTRVIMGTDISTGKPVNLTSFATTGDANATHTNSVPSQLKPTCWLRNIGNTCDDEQKSKIGSGQGVIINGVLYNDASDWHAPASAMTSEAGFPGSVPVGMTATTVKVSGTTATVTTTVSKPTGVFVATSTPSPSKKSAASGHVGFDAGMIGLVSVSLVLMLIFA